MASKRKKAVPVTRRNDKPARFKRSSAETARLIRRFHVLNKELAKCGSDSARRKEILAEMEAMGGLDWYQKASQLGQSKTRGGDSSKWLVRVLQEHGYRKPNQTLRLLDVGAVSPDNYKRHASWISAKPIDLNPQDPRIEKQDFLEMAPSAEFDVVSLSLVVNFVGDPKDRGRMLLHSRHFLDGARLLFLVLPLPCITNSRYMSHEHLLSMMQSMGYTRTIDYHFSNKLAYYLFELSQVRDCATFKKKLLPGKEGGKRNNFAIVIDPS